MKNFLPHLIAIAVFFVVFGTYFSPVFDDKTLPQNDILQSQASAQETKEYREESGEEPLWNGRIFSGMPTYMLATRFPGNYFESIKNTIRSWMPAELGALFIQYICFYILLCVLRVRPYLAMVGAIGFVLSTFNMLSLEAGHVWKILTMGFTPLLLAGLVLLARKKYLIGGITYAIGVAFMIGAKHYQIVFYFAIFLLPFFIHIIVYYVKRGEFKPIILTAAIILVGGALGIGPNVSELWTSVEYNKYTMRGGSELTPLEQTAAVDPKTGVPEIDEQNEKEESSDGLKKDYAFAWSQGKWESMTLFVPRLYGGASHEELSKSSELHEALKDLRVPAKSRKQIIANAPTYWGDQPFTGGPMYAGIIFLFLAIIAFFILDFKQWLWILIGSLLLLFISWGSNMQWMNYTLFDHFPMFNKFRTVAMAIFFPMMGIVILGSMALEKIAERYNPEKLMERTMIGVYVTGGIFVLILLVGFFLDFRPSDVDKDYATFQNMGFPEQSLDDVVAAIESDRASVFYKDFFRSVIFIGLAFLAIWYYLKAKLQPIAVVLMVGLLALVDQWSINKRYLNSDSFVAKKESHFPKKSKADEVILKDTDLSYRVLNLNNPFNEAYTSIYHKSIGGYHGLKMVRYQDLIDRHISGEMRQLIGVLQKSPTQASIDNAFEKAQVLNMLNTKYVIYNPGVAPLENSKNFGEAWFVSSITKVSSPDEEIAAIRAGNSDLRTTAILDESKFSVNKTSFNTNGASIEMTNYAPNKVSYKTSNSGAGFAVFSETFYDKGWTATIDGKEAPIVRVNYILRGVEIPQGDHEVVFKFHPESYFKGETIAQTCSIILIVVFLGGIAFVGYREFKNPTVASAEEGAEKEHPREEEV